MENIVIHYLQDGLFLINSLSVYIALVKHNMRHYNLLILNEVFSQNGVIAVLDKQYIYTFHMKARH